LLRPEAVVFVLGHSGQSLPIGFSSDIGVWPSTHLQPLRADFGRSFITTKRMLNWPSTVGVAQLVERRSVAPNVAGSIPVSHPKPYQLKTKSFAILPRSLSAEFIAQLLHKSSRAPPIFVSLPTARTDALLLRDVGQLHSSFPTFSVHEGKPKSVERR
jgi:hypothetical protein